jgi:thiamine-phosphate pyrophosphorylase
MASSNDTDVPSTNDPSSPPRSDLAETPEADETSGEATHDSQAAASSDATPRPDARTVSKGEMGRRIGRLHVITDFKMQQIRSHADLARLALRGGADTIQFRQKHGGIRNVLSQAHATQAVCTDASMPLIVNDRVDVAQAVGAAGVHLGQEDFPIAEARALLGDEAIIGATANTVSQVVKAYEQGATYVGFGPVFETRSKRNVKSVTGLETLARACEAVPIPVIAIGGITHDRVRPTLEAGAYGVAVLSSVATSKNPERAAARFRAAIDGALRTQNDA